MAENVSALYAARVNQLDAAVLDEEFNSVLVSQLTTALQHIRPEILAKYQPELKALLKLTVWVLTVQASHSTVGQQLLELRYQATPGGNLLLRLCGLAGVYIGLPWFKERCMGISGALGERINTCVFILENICKLANIISFLIFLQEGKYKDIAERLLGIRTVNSAGPEQALREVQYEYMNRELLWHGFIEFATFIIPLINLRRLKGTVKRFLFSFRSDTKSPQTEMGPAIDFSHCVICEEWPILPRTIGCRHVFCYYCISSQVISDPQFQCPFCHFQANGITSVNPVPVLF